MIVGVVNQKGGVGKSTISLNLAHFLALDGSRVLLIDTDKQRSAAKWASKRDDDNPPPFHLIEMARDNLARDAMAMAQDYDHVIIDGPRDAEKITRAVIISSEFVLLPYEPSGFSTDAGQITVEQVKECQIIKPDLLAGIAISRRIEGTVIGTDIRAVAEEAGLPLLKSSIATRVAHAEAVTLAQTIFEHEPNGKAAKEIRALAEEIQGMYHGQEELHITAESKTAAYA